MKKLIALLVTTSTILSCFTGCGDKTAEELNDIANSLYKGVNSSLTELDEEGIDVGGTYWFDSDKNISDTASEDILSHTEDLYSKVSDFYSDSGLYEWVMYCEGGTVKEAYAAENFDNEVVGYFSNTEGIDISGKTLNDVKQEIDVKITTEKPQVTTTTEVKTKTNTETETKTTTAASVSNNKCSLDQFEKRLDSLIESYLLQSLGTEQFNDNFKLSEREMAEGSSNIFSYSYGTYNLTIGTDANGYIKTITSVANGYMSNSKYEAETKAFLLGLQLLPYAATLDYDISETLDLENNLLDNADYTNKYEPSYEYDDKEYNYSLSTSSYLTMFLMSLKD